jgi:hypothetical protein
MRSSVKHLECQDLDGWILFSVNSTGLAAPAIAAGFTAIAPTLHALVPVIGASGFASIATAAEHTAGSVVVAASFGGKPGCSPSGDEAFVSSNYRSVLMHVLIHACYLAINSEVFIILDTSN